MGAICGSGFVLWELGTAMCRDRPGTISFTLNTPDFSIPISLGEMLVASFPERKPHEKLQLTWNRQVLPMRRCHVTRVFLHLSAAVFTREKRRVFLLQVSSF